MKSSDFVADRSCFCLLPSFVYVQQLSDSGEVGGVNCMKAGHFEAKKKTKKLRLVFQLL